MERIALLKEMYFDTLLSIRQNMKTNNKTELKKNLIILRKIIQFSERPTKNMLSLESSLSRAVKVR